MIKNYIPNSTQIPNDFLDLLLPRLPEAESRCILYICRRTYGFHKEIDRISLSQFVEGIISSDNKRFDYGAGVTKAPVVEAIRNLIKSGAINKTDNSKGNYYQINLDMDIDEVVEKVNRFRKQTRSGLVNKPKQGHLPTTQNKGKQRETKVYASGSKEPSAHSQFIKFFYDTCDKVRGVKPVITGKDGQNLKRVLELEIVKEQELEQIALYFLSDRYYRKFAPSISTFLSAGIINGLADSLRNRPTFWKELNEYMVKNYQRPAIQSENIASRLISMKAALISKQRMSVPQTNDYEQE